MFRSANILNFPESSTKGTCIIVSNFDLSADDLRSPSALLVLSDGGGDYLAVRINGTEALSSEDGYIPLGNLAHEGKNTAEILFENLGCPNFGPVIEQGRESPTLALCSRPEASHPAEGWRMKVVTGDPVDLPEVPAEFRRP